jgi:hypothetical protein
MTYTLVSGQTPEVAQGAAAPALTLRMIVASSVEAATALLQRLKQGESFVALAKAESTAPSADAGGWLGRVPLAQLRPEVRRCRSGSHGSSAVISCCSRSRSIRRAIGRRC